MNSIFHTSVAMKVSDLRFPCIKEILQGSSFLLSKARLQGSVEENIPILSHYGI